MARDTFQKAAAMQDAADKLVKSYEDEGNTNSDAYQMSVKFREELHGLSNASLARLHDIIHLQAGD